MGVPTPTRFWNRSVLYRRSAGYWLLSAAGAVFVGLIPCGLSTRDSNAGPGLEPSTTGTSNLQPTGLPNNDESIKQGSPIMPKFVITNPVSPDPNARLRVLDYWNTTHTKIPLSHVFEAMEDEDEAVRASATAIVEQQWAREQYVIDLTFSTTRSNSDQLIIRNP